MQTTFIGGGNMAGALIGGMIGRGQAPGTLAAVDPDAAQRARLAERFGIGLHASIEAAAAAGALGAPVLVLAVKPQQMRDVAGALASHLDHAPLVISIAAGIRARDLAGWLGGRARVLRTMPNTPALIGAGITALAMQPALTPEDRTRAEAVLSACGQTVWVEDESLLDAVTAISGSGPAYVFHFMEAMQAAAREMGLDEDQARRLTLATFAGAARLAANSDPPVAVLRAQVTSKGGTTAAALEHMAAQGLARHFIDAMHAARRRSVELGEALGDPSGPSKP